MNEHSGAEIVLFGGFRFDRRRAVLSRQNGDGSLAPVAIGSRALEILGLLIDRHGDIVSRNEILKLVWPGVVEGANVTVQISALRRALDDGGSEGSMVQTIPGRGYRFVAAVTHQMAETSAGASSMSGDTELVSDRVRSLAAPRMSIVVLPFANLSNDPDQQYFADGITEDVTTDLSRIAGMFVISRNTAFTYKDRRTETKQLGRELNVRYVLEGSVRRLGERVRISAQLIDVETDAHLWAERFDVDKNDLFALQNDLTGRIANTLNLELIVTESARSTDRSDVMDYILRGRAAADKTPSPERYEGAIAWYERALLLDPQSVEAQCRLAGQLAGRVLDDMTATAAADLVRAESLAGRALAASPRSPLAHNARGQVLRAQCRWDEAIPEYETAAASNPNWVYALHGLGQCKLYAGSIEETIPLMERAIRLSPRDPQLGIWYVQIGQVHLMQSRIGEAIIWLERARTHIPTTSATRAYLASAYALNGDTERAAAELAEARRLSSDGRFSSIARLRAVRNWGVPKIRALVEATYFAGLRKAGMPEE